MIQLGRAGILKHPEQDRHDNIAHHHAQKRRSHQGDDNLADTGKIQPRQPHVRHEDAANHATYQGVRRGAGQANLPGQQVPDNRSHQRSDNNRLLYMSHHNIATDGLRHAGTDHSPQEVQHGSHHNGLARGNGTGGNRSSDSIGSIMEAIDKIKHKSQHDYDNYKRMNIKHTSLPHLLTSLPFSHSGQGYSPAPPAGP